ncbi:MAG: nucleotidyltransferase substrate binding protein [Tepidimonas ignava]
MDADIRWNNEGSLHRDGLVQRFEFTYEVAHRLLKRYLETKRWPWKWSTASRRFGRQRAFCVTPSTKGALAHESAAAAVAPTGT